MSADTKIARQLAEKFAEDRAHRLATIHAEEFVRCNGIPTDTPDQFIFHGADIADDHFQDCVAHLKWAGECVTFDGDSDDELVVMLGDYSMGSLS